MASRTLGFAFEGADGKNIDMAGQNLKHATPVIQKLRATDVERDAVRQLEGGLPVNRRIAVRARLVHSSATSLVYAPWRRSNCSCVPRSAILPRSSTIISSQSRIVLKR